jgi:hypothetical protein
MEFSGIHARRKPDSVVGVLQFLVIMTMPFPSLAGRSWLAFSTRQAATPGKRSSWSDFTMPWHLTQNANRHCCAGPPLHSNVAEGVPGRSRGDCRLQDTNPSFLDRRPRRAPYSPGPWAPRTTRRICHRTANLSGRWYPWPLVVIWKEKVPALGQIAAVPKDFSVVSPGDQVGVVND